MAKKELNNSNKQKFFGPIAHFMYGEILSLDFFKQHWGTVLAVVVYVIFCIMLRFACQARQSRINQLQREFDICETQRIQECSKFNTMIRESNLVNYLHKNNIDLIAPDAPNYIIER